MHRVSNHTLGVALPWFATSIYQCHAMMLLYVSASFYNGFLYLLWNIISSDEGNFLFGGQSLAKTLDYKAIRCVGMVRPANL